MLYLVSDTHFFHNRIIEYCNRPFKDVGDMNKQLVEKWNKTVKPDDTVIVAGDFGFVNQETGKIVRLLHGRKTIVKGNHDSKLQFLVRLGFDYAYDELCFTYEGIRFKVSHYPYSTTWYGRIKSWLKGYNERFHERRPSRIREGWLLHGHVHNAWGQINRERKMINVSCDVWNYRPVAITEIIGLINKEKK